MNSYSKTLRAFRNKCSLSQEQVSNILGINRTTYTGYETGKTKPDFDTIVKICDIFGITISMFTDYYLKQGNINALASDKPEYKKSKSEGECLISVTTDEEILLSKYRMIKNKNQILKIIEEFEDSENIKN